MPEFVGIEITKPLPATAVVDSTYKTEGSVKIFDALGAPPWVYARVKRKEWYKPEFTEEAKYDRGWPVPFTGDFTIEFKPEKEGEYEVTVVATPAPLALPAIGVFPVLAESDVMKVSVGQKPPAVFRFSGVTIDGNKINLGNHDADSKLLIQKKTTDSLEIIPSFEWVGPKKSATISIKAGYRDLLGGFTPKTDAYTTTIELPESPDTPYSGVGKAITIPLTACGDIGDGAIEIVAKLPDMGDYISRIWNVYATKPAVVSFRFSAIIIDGHNVPLGNHDADSGLLLAKTTADSLSINPTFEWQGSKKAASISIKAGYRDLAGGFTPKTDAYTATFELPDSIDKKYSGQLNAPITVPLTACGGLDDGAIEVVLKISGFPDYITHIWNVYATKAPEEELGFDLTRPTVSQTPVAPGTTIDITCPVKSTCAKAVDATAKVIIYEGSLAPGHGTKIKDYDSGVFHINPGETKNVIVHHTTVAGTIDRRDVEVEVYVGGQLIKESEWDDVYYVKAAEVELETLQVNIDPAGAGYVTTDPSPSGGTENNWQFPKGATVYVTAHPNSGYVFKSWSGEMTDTTAITAPVYQMTETRTITAHFEKVVVEQYTLSVSVNPYGGGTVTKSPDKTTYAKGEYVTLYASPSSGYEFDYWSGDASGYSTSVSVYMDGNKSVVANFKKQLPPPTQLVSFAVHSKGPPFPTGYWMLMHYTMDGALDFQSQVTPIETNISVTGVQSAGRLSVFTSNAITGEWRDQVYSNYFAATDDGEYTYDINTGIVYMGFI